MPQDIVVKANSSKIGYKCLSIDSDAFKSKVWSEQGVCSLLGARGRVTPCLSYGDRAVMGRPRLSLQHAGGADHVNWFQWRPIQCVAGLATAGWHHLAVCEQAASGVFDALRRCPNSSA